MSSITVSYSRKRIHGHDHKDSYDLEDELPPVKIRRNSASAKIPVAFAARLKNIALWISELPVKGFFTMAVKAGSSLPAETIVIDDDEDDDVIPIEEDEEEEEERPNPFIKRLEQSQKHSVLNNQRFRAEFDLNGPCQTRYQTRAREVTVAYDSRFDSSKSHNGHHSWRLRNASNGAHSLRPTHRNKVSSPVSNPSTDVEVLLDSPPPVLAAESDEVEIILDSSQPAASHKPLHPRASGKSDDPLPGPSRSVAEGSTALNKAFTAHEVSRLQEKAQYQLLLQKYIGGSPYYKPVRKAEDDVQINPKCAEFTGTHFKKDVLQIPVTGFLEKYCKPCQLVSHVKPSKPKEKANEVVEITIDDDEDENEIEVVDVKLPKYKASYQQKPDFFSPNWINELKKTVNSQVEERMRIVQDYEKELEKRKKERLLGKLNYGLEISDSSEPALPALTSEMEEMVDKALHGDPKEPICKVSDVVLRKDIETLDGLNWLNDLIINTYFDLIVERSKQEGYPSVHAFNTFFYSTYKSKGYSNVRRWTRKTDIFSYDLNFVPIHLGIHWCLGVIDHRQKKICYYDSMGSGEDLCLDLLHEYLSLEYKDKKGAYLDPSIYTTEAMQDIPQQMNGSDCGMFTLKYAEYISRNAKITFSQKDMPYFRRRTIYEIITNKLL